MLPYLTHFPVHWIDGMQVSKTHFMESFNALNDHLRDAYALRLTPYNYGILLAEPEGGLNLKLHERRLRLTACRAITIGGVRIEISDNTGFNMPELTYNVPTDNENGDYHVILIADPLAGLL